MSCIWSCSNQDGFQVAKGEVYKFRINESIICSSSTNYKTREHWLPYFTQIGHPNKINCRTDVNTHTTREMTISGNIPGSRRAAFCKRFCALRSSKNAKFWPTAFSQGTIHGTNGLPPNSIYIHAKVSPKTQSYVEKREEGEIIWAEAKSIWSTETGGEQVENKRAMAL